VEELLAQAGDALSAAGSAHSILANAELKFTPATDSSGVEFELAQGTINLLLTSPDRELRRSAWTHYADAHLAYRNTMATSLAGGVKRDVLSARAHNYSSCLEAALAPNEIPLAAFKNVIDSFRANLPTWHRYWEVRASMLGLDRLEPFDMRAHLTEKEVSVPFSKAVNWVADGMSPLGEEYVSTLRRGVLDQRWVGHLPQSRKADGGLFHQLTGNPSLHLHELQRRRARGQHAGPRTGPLNALPPLRPAAAVRVFALQPVRRRGGLEFQPGAGPLTSPEPGPQPRIPDCRD